MKKIIFWFALIVGILAIIGSCSTSKDTKTTTTTSSTTLPDYATTTLSGKIVGTSWTFKTGRATVPTSSTGSYWVTMTNDNLSNA